MLFNIDSDNGTRIEGWIMPDNPSVTPEVVVVVAGETVASIKAQVLRPLLREQGLHATGVCGFVVDTRNCPQLKPASDVEVYDTGTGVRVYRRPPASTPIPIRLFRLETQLLRNAALNDVLDQNFHMTFTRLEMVPEETVRSMLGISFTNSIYATGRVSFRVFGPLLRDRGFKTSAYLRDPIEELAEQLLVLRLSRRFPSEQLRGVLQERLMQLAEVIDPHKLTAPEDYAAWLTQLSPASRFPLVDPVTKLLTCLSPDDRVEPQGVAEALEMLGECAAVGFSDDLDTFAAHLEVALDSHLPPIPSTRPSDRVLQLAAHLRDMPIAREMLAADLELFGALRDAWRRTVEALPDSDLPSDSHHNRSRTVSK